MTPAQTPSPRTFGLEQGVVRLVPHQEAWARLFTEEQERLIAVLDGHALDIQHVGSTAIPGLAAKPILDIAIAVTSFEEATACVPLMEQAGYEYEGENGIPRRHYFVKREPPYTTHHVHMLEWGSAPWEEHLLFRDYLRTHPQAVQEYAALKEELAQRFRHDRPAYTEAKASFVRRVLALARQEKEA